MGGFGSFTCPAAWTSHNTPAFDFAGRTLELTAAGFSTGIEGGSCPGGNRAMQFYTETRTTGCRGQGSARYGDTEQPVNGHRGVAPAPAGRITWGSWLECAYPQV